MPPTKKTPPLAADFASFIELVCTKPVHFFNELPLCYTRFSGGPILPTMTRTLDNVVAPSRSPLNTPRYLNKNCPD